SYHAPLSPPSLPTRRSSDLTAPDQIHIIDLGSQKGTFVNGQKVNKHALRSGDEIKLGETRVVVTIGQAISQAAQAPAQAAAEPARPKARVVMQQIDPAEVEQLGTLSAELQLVFEWTPLQVLHLAPPRRLFVGDAHGCDFFIAKNLLGRERAPLVWTDHETPPKGMIGAEFSFCFPEQCEGEIAYEAG